MAQYTDSYVFSKDIDWFFKMNNQYVHVASAGGRLPAIINDREKLRQIQYQVFNLPYIYPAGQIRIYEGFIQQLLSSQLNEIPQSYDLYIESFINFARKGFISCDRTNIADNQSDLYHIVCMPPSCDNNIQIENIPIIINHNYKFEINQINLNFLKIIK